MHLTILSPSVADLFICTLVIFRCWSMILFTLAAFTPSRYEHVIPYRDRSATLERSAPVYSLTEMYEEQVSQSVDLSPRVFMQLFFL